jgi:hypothetical protein
VTLLGLIVGGWLCLAVLCIGLLNVAKWMVRSRARGAAPTTSGTWAGAAQRRSEPSALPPPFVASAATARQDGIGQYPASR